MMENRNGSLRENEDWSNGDENGPIRKVFGGLFGLWARLSVE